MNRAVTEMEERVATALWQRMNGSEAMDKYDHNEFIGHAAAIIRAMREPTHAMRSKDTHGEMWGQHLLSTWQNMIDAASPPDAP